PEAPSMCRDDLRSEPVFLLGEHHANLRAPAQTPLQLLKALLRQRLQVRGHRHVAPREFDGHVPSEDQNACLRWEEEGIFSSSRYFATVRRAIWIPSARSRCMIRASDCGRRVSSSEMIRAILFLIEREETSPPSTESIPLWKKYFIGKRPRGVWMYLFERTRDTVDSCMPMSLATSRRTKGRRCSIPLSRKARW